MHMFNSFKSQFRKKYIYKNIAPIMLQIFFPIQILPFKGLTDELSTFTRNTLHTMKNIFFGAVVQKYFTCIFKNLTILLFQRIHWPKM